MPSCSKLALHSTSLSRTLTHLEQAIANVVSSKEPLDYSHVLSAYSRIYHSVNTEPYFATEAALRFEITLGKYVEPKEKVGSPFHAFAKCILDIRTELMEHKVALSAKLFEGQSLPCPCCGDVLSEEIIRLKLGLLDGAPSPGELLFRDLFQSPRLIGHLMLVTAPAVGKGIKRRNSRRLLKSSRSKKVSGRFHAFDPYGPSTSASSM